MLEVDQRTNTNGVVENQTVFRGKLVKSMLDQGLIQDADLNFRGELIRSSAGTNGLLRPGVAFQLTNAYGRSGNFSLIFNDRSGMVGDYVFHSCWFKPQQI